MISKLKKEMKTNVQLYSFIMAIHDAIYIVGNKLTNNYLDKRKFFKRLGGNIFITDNNFDEKKVIKDCRSWLKHSYGQGKLEWCYKNIDRRVLVQDYLDFGSELPPDYKLHMIEGKLRIIQVIYGRPNNTKEILYDENWNMLKETFTYPQGVNSDLPKPAKFDAMALIAEKLSEDFNYARVDLYEHKGEVMFGEITHYPQAGMLSCSEELDFKLGGYFK
jgi:hypothetical protein